MKRRVLKAGIVLTEVVALLVAILGGLLIYTAWRVEQGPIDLATFRASAAFAMERRLPPGSTVSVDELVLSRAEAKDAYDLTFGGLFVENRGSGQSARVPQLTLAFKPSDLIRGQFDPSVIVAEDMDLNIIRDATRRIDIPVVHRESVNPVGALMAPAFGDNAEASPLENVRLHVARLNFFDAASGRTWNAPNALIKMTRDEDGRISAALYADIIGDSGAARLSGDAAFLPNERIIDLNVNGDAVPMGDLLSTLFGEAAAFIDAPVSGEAAMRLTADGAVLASTFKASINEGFLRLGEQNAEISSIDFSAAFSPDTNQFSIDRLNFDAGGQRGSFTGIVALQTPADERTPTAVQFELSGERIEINAGDAMPGPVPVERVTAIGRYDRIKREIDITELSVGVRPLVLNGAATITIPQTAADGRRPSPGVVAMIATEGALMREDLLALWPYGAGSGARDWVEERLETALIDNIRAEINMPVGYLDDKEETPDDAYSLSFDARDAVAYYNTQMTPIREGRGRGVLRGNSFFLDVEYGRIGEIDLTDGEVDIPVFIPKWEPAFYRFTASGASEDILGVLDEAPLNLLSKINLEPKQFAGKAVAVVEIMRPNKRDVAPQAYRYNGRATFEDMTVSGLFGELQFDNANGSVELQTRNIVVAANAEAAGAPIDLVWRQNFYAEDGPSSFDISGVVDASTGDLFGIPSRQFVRGPVAFQAKAKGDVGRISTLTLDADFTDASLSLPALGWRKETGASVTASLIGRFDDNETAFESIRFAGDGVEIAGDVLLSSGGVLRSADFDRFFLDQSIDARLAVRRSDMGSLDVTVIGPLLDVGPAIETALTSSGGGNSDGDLWGDGLRINARIDALRMRNDAAYNIVLLDLWRDRETLQSLSFAGFDDDGAPLTVSHTATGEEAGARSILEAHTTNIGLLLKGVLGLQSIEGGEGVMRVDLDNPGQRGFAGAVEARNMTVVNAPLLARVFSAGSLDGLSNLLNGEGINLEYGYGRFNSADGVLSFADVRASGPSVGITADGDIRLNDGTALDLRGAVAPFYQLNSALGNAPLIGELFVRKEGEGLFALGYSVSGTPGSPVVTVNPLTALTPGIFRNMSAPAQARPAEPAMTDE